MMPTYQPNIDLSGVLRMLAGVMERMTGDTAIGRILMPGPTYLGMWARDTGVAALGLNRLGKSDLAGELLARYWRYQITEDSDPARFIFRNKRCADWTDADSFQPTRPQLLAEAGAFPTSVYIQTPNFPAGTREIYGIRADLDGSAWLIIALHDYYCYSRDDALLHRLAPQVVHAVAYLRSRDVDGDHLLEQQPNEDWADTLLRHGKVSYSQAVWYKCLEAAEHVFALVGDRQRAADCRRERAAVQRAINQILFTELGYYADYLGENGYALRRSLDTALLVAFGIAAEEQARSTLAILDGLEGPYGPAVVTPGYLPADTGPSKYPPGQYQNEGVWPWIAGYLSLAWARVGERERAARIIDRILGPNPYTIHEWVDNVTGERHHPDFATGAGALAWAITEGELASTLV